MDIRLNHSLLGAVQFHLDWKINGLTVFYKMVLLTWINIHYWFKSKALLNIDLIEIIDHMYKRIDLTNLHNYVTQFMEHSNYREVLWWFNILVYTCMYTDVCMCNINLIKNFQENLLSSEYSSMIFYILHTCSPTFIQALRSVETVIFFKEICHHSYYKTDFN